MQLQKKGGPLSVENTDPVTGMWKDAAGVRHIIGGDFLQDYTACGIKDGSISEILP